MGGLNTIRDPLGIERVEGGYKVLMFGPDFESLG